MVGFDIDEEKHALQVVEHWESALFSMVDALGSRAIPASDDGSNLHSPTSTKNGVFSSWSLRDRLSWIFSRELSPACAQELMQKGLESSWDADLFSLGLEELLPEEKYIFLKSADVQNNVDPPRGDLPALKLKLKKSRHHHRSLEDEEDDDDSDFVTNEKGKGSPPDRLVVRIPANSYSLRQKRSREVKESDDDLSIVIRKTAAKKNRKKEKTLDTNINAFDAVKGTPPVVDSGRAHNTRGRRVSREYLSAVEDVDVHSLAEIQGEEWSDGLGSAEDDDEFDDDVEDEEIEDGNEIEKIAGSRKKRSRAPSDDGNCFSQRVTTTPLETKYSERKISVRQSLLKRMQAGRRVRKR